MEWVFNSEHYRFSLTDDGTLELQKGHIKVILEPRMAAQVEALFQSRADAR